MDEILYKSALKNKKNELINSLNLLGENISKKITEKNNIITALNKELSPKNSDKTAELESFKEELNEILEDIDTIINNITK